MSRQRRSLTIEPPRRSAGPDGVGLFGKALIVICVLAASLRGAILVEYLRRNPFAQAPVTDGAVYWEWAGRIANGQSTGQMPFASAPLYPYVLGALRALGGDLASVYALQLVLDLLTVALLAGIGRQRFGESVGLAAAACWLIVDEPAFYITRVLNSSLQVFLVVVLWALLLRWQERGGWKAALFVGGALGFNCLANPTMMLLLPILPVWMVVSLWRNGRQSDRGSRGRRRPIRSAIGQAAIGLGLAVLVIAPATLHNWRACGEFIPITACPGITLRQGNGPGAVGTYVPIPGVSGGRDTLFADAACVYQKATGRPARWRDVDAYFRDQAIAYWRDDPARAGRLILRRAYWFVAGRYYCDVHQPTWERDQGFARLLWLAPIPTAWLIGPAIVGLIALIRRPIQYAPEWLLLAVPLVVVAVFQYSPRYRLPAVPVIVLLATWAWAQAIRRPVEWRWTAGVGGATALAIALGPINKATGFEDPAGLMYNNEYNLAVALIRLDRKKEAIERLERALRILPTSAEAHNDLAVLLAERREFDRAISHYESALRARPGWARAELNLGIAYANRRDFARAIERYRRAQRARPDWPEVSANLVIAHEHLAAIEEQRQNRDQAIAHWQEALKIDPTRNEARNRLAIALMTSRRYDQAVAALRECLRRRPDDLTAANNLAWLLATCPRDHLRNGDEAVAIAERISRVAGREQPGILDSLAAAYAESGRFDRAIETAESALALARARNDSALAEQVVRRLALYRQGRAFHEAE